jgi:hypothetical protein
MAYADQSNICNGLAGGSKGLPGHDGCAPVGAAGDAVDGRRVEGFTQGHGWQNFGEAPGQHRLASPKGRYGQHTCNRNDLTMVAAGAFGDLPWLEVQGAPPARDAPLVAW